MAGLIPRAGLTALNKLLPGRAVGSNPTLSANGLQPLPGIRSNKEGFGAPYSNIGTSIGTS